MEIKELYLGKYYRVVRGRSQEPADRVVVSFLPWRKHPNLSQDAFGTPFFNTHNISFVGVVPGQNCWYQHQEIEIALSYVAAEIGSRIAFGYGSSMGAYAVLNFANILGLDCGLVLAPQFSISPKLAKFETRWREEAEAIEFQFDLINTISSTARITMVYDNSNLLDAAHIELIRGHFPCSRFLPIESSGHEVIRWLSKKRILRDLILGSLSGEL